MGINTAKFIKLTSHTTGQAMWVNRNYVMMIEPLMNGSRVWVIGGDHGNVKIVKESAEKVVELMNDQEPLKDIDLNNVVIQEYLARD